jgi:predicted RNA-binding protein Jag
MNNTKPAKKIGINKDIVLRIIISILTVIIQSAVVVAVYFYTRPPLFPTLILAASYIIIMALNFFVNAFFTYKFYHSNVIVLKFNFVTVLTLINSLSNLTHQLFENMNKIAQNILNKNIIADIMDFNNATLSLTNDINSKIHEIMEDKNFSFNKKELSNLISDIDELKNITDKLKYLFENKLTGYADEVINLKNHIDIVIKNTSKFYYYMKLTTPIIGELSSASSDYSLKMIKSVYDKFGDISKSSNDIYEHTQQTIAGFMDENKNDSLGYLLKEFKDIKVEVDDFYKTMTELKAISTDFLTSSIDSFKELGVAASITEDISEKIKVIAINVRIEASRVSSDSGFKVLGKEISEFANITSKSAKESVKRIRETTEALEILKNDYINKLNGVYGYLTKIQDSFVSFENIINSSFSKIKGVVEYLENLSTDINDRIKETIGKLQFFDLTTQESAHIIHVIKTLSEYFHTLIKDLDIENKISKEKEEKIIADIIDNFDKLITTESERKIIEKKAAEYGIILGNVKGLENVKRLDDNTILF